MLTDRPTTLPPSWAETLLRMMLAPKDRDSVSGDLLEEYRDSIVPSRGAGARRWYIRQVAGYVVRQTWMWGAIVASILVGRFLLDIFAPIHYTPHVVALRGSVMSWTLIATFVLCAACHAWRSGYFRTGVFAALAAAWTGAALTTLGTAAVLAIWHDAATMWAIQGSGGLGEALWGVPLLLTPIGVIAGLQGAVVGRVAVAIYGASRPNTKSA